MNSIKPLSKSLEKGYKPLPLDDRGWGGNSPIFSEICSEYKPKVVIEVGTWKGQSAINFCKLSKKYTDDFKLYCVDTWLGATEFWTTLAKTEERNLMLKNGYPSIYDQFISNIIHHGFTKNVYPVPLPSSIASEVLSSIGVRADLAYIDGSHTYEDVLSDLHKYSKIVSSSGIILCDDYQGCWAGVIKAVDEFCLKTNWRIINKKGKHVILKRD